jgi:large subunit ribosomal protein L13
MKTFVPKKDKIVPKWYLVDLKNKVVGRAASRIASILRGKHKVEYVPYLDVGDYVVAINAAQMKVTGKKLEKKIFYHHSGFPGGLKKESLASLFQRKPEEVFRKAVWGMLPKNNLRKKLIKKLKVYPEAEHPHKAQKLEFLEL